MSRIIPFAAAAASSLLLLSATAGFAAGTAHYTAKPVAAPTKASVITKNTIWRCADGVCAAPKAGSRPEIMCALVAQRVGQLSAFTVAGAPFDAAKLDRCNSVAK